MIGYNPMYNPYSKPQLPRNSFDEALEQLMQIKSMGSSDTMFAKMYNSNPQFKQFADSMKGKTPEQAFSENGFDFNRFKQLKW